MNHYPHHIGDFDKATRHLTRLERSIYRDLMDVYYDTENRLALDRNDLCRRIIARSTDEQAAVEQVLKEFFVETSTGWFHSRCESEIQKFKANNTQKSKAGKASAASKAKRKQDVIAGKDDGNERSTSVQRQNNGTSTNQNQNQNQNHKPKTKAKSKTDAQLALLFACDIPERLALQWLEIRKEKKLVLNETALDLTKEEARKAGITLLQAITRCCGEGWGGFKASWLEDKSSINAAKKLPSQDDFENKDYGIGVQSL